MADEYQQVTIGKFIFRVRDGYLYTEDGLWLSPQAGAGTVRLGLSDFRQQSSGDMAFVELPAVGQAVQGGEISPSSRRSRSTWTCRRLSTRGDGRQRDAWPMRRN